MSHEVFVPYGIHNNECKIQYQLHVPLLQEGRIPQDSGAEEEF
jgi:hypothetical protein